MKKHNKIYATATSFLAIFFFMGASTIKAHCPLCVAGAGAGLTLSRWIGLDDAITGVWMAALLGAVSFWTYSWLTGKLNGKPSLWLKPLVILAIFTSTIWSFYRFNLIVTMEKIYGLDKLTFGIILGGTAFYLMDEINTFLLKKFGKSLFPYQRLVTGLGVILILSIVLDILIGYYI